MNLLKNMKFKRFVYFQIGGFILCAILLCSCNEPVELNNPFDPEVEIPYPENFHFLSETDTTLTFQWTNNIRIYNEEQEKQCSIIIEQSWNIQNFWAIDTARAPASSITTKKIGHAGQAPYYVYFHAYTQVGSRRSYFSGLTWYYLYGSSFSK